MSPKLRPVNTWVYSTIFVYFLQPLKNKLGFVCYCHRWYSSFLITFPDNFFVEKNVIKKRKKKGKKTKKTERELYIKSVIKNDDVNNKLRLKT